MSLNVLYLKEGGGEKKKGKKSLQAMSSTRRDKKRFPCTIPLLCSSLLMGSLVRGTFQHAFKAIHSKDKQSAAVH